jgi:hypothetical protein
MFWRNWSHNDSDSEPRSESTGRIPSEKAQSEYPTLAREIGDKCKRLSVSKNQTHLFIHGKRKVVA